MPARDRFSDEQIPGSGSAQKFSAIGNDTSLSGTIRSCSDIIGNYGGQNYFNSDVKTNEPGLASGYYDHDLWADNWSIHLPALAHLPLTGIDGGSAFATKTAARTNPSQAHVSLPTFIGELAELPFRVRAAGLKLMDKQTVNARSLSGANLTYQFAIKPLVNDLVKMLDFTAAAEKRYNELKVLEQRGLSRGIKGKGGTASFTSGLTVLHSFYFRYECRIKFTTTSEVWSSVRWKPNPSTFPKSDVGKRKAAHRLVRGLTHANILPTVWELVPWSWLADYIGSVGDYLLAIDNSVAVLNGPVCVMTHSKSESIAIEPAMSSFITSSNPRRYRETKNRMVFYPTPFAASMPFLSGRQLSILGSLAILKGRKLS